VPPREKEPLRASEGTPYRPGGEIFFASSPECRATEAERVRPPRPFGPRASGSERPQGTEGQDAPESRSAAREGGSATVPGGPKRTRAVRKRAQGPGGLALSRRTARRQHSDRTETHGNSPLRNSINTGGSGRQNTPKQQTEAATSGRVALLSPAGRHEDSTATARKHTDTLRFSTP
jgi:hypothetical protein